MKLLPVLIVLTVFSQCYGQPFTTESKDKKELWGQIAPYFSPPKEFQNKFQNS